MVIPQQPAIPDEVTLLVSPSKALNLKSQACASPHDVVESGGNPALNKRQMR
jgi:hypothetical protein